MPPKKDVKEEKILLGRPSNNLKIGIVGLPNVGKSTFFNCLTNSSVPAENYPFCTIDPEESRVAVPDERYDWLCEKFKPASKVSAWLTVIDIAGLVKGAAGGAGLGNAFLSHIRAVDAIFHVLRSFDDVDIVHVEGDINPVRDVAIIREELRIKDEEFLKNKLDALTKGLRAHQNDKQYKFELDTVEKLYNHVTVDKKDVRHGDWNIKEIEVINPLQLLTAKTVVYLANVSEKDYLRKKNKWLPKIKEWIDANTPGDQLIPISVCFESALSRKSPEEAAAYLKEVDTVSMLPKIITSGYNALNLIYFFTAGEDEVRAWTIRKGTKAPQAAGVIHTDFERGFIMAEIMKYADFKELGSEVAVKAAGKYLQKGKEHVIEDGDMIFFKFNVTATKKK